MTITIHLYGPHAGQHAEVKGKEGKSLMEAAVAANIEGIAADCGGLMTCATCHVYVRAPWAQQLPPPSDEENGMLGFTAAERQPHSRLSCQIELKAALDGLEVDLPPTQY
ncbi:2Fe-2S iron-sulfur cluster-binding protein [Ramlibacter albus]|uniref:2Fe-2S iron-sulfur cluster binding domain-containing protein n=1 Tax=Ramlibacter albus TaxID=2079448 RepID=A0A923S5K1_9BURK|nr:2Fe-2S iron-sulfur cluster-binding protein [Ramlibacter albus]MBC5768621.1 2Fe-2S iron-sulfur cluster binding domain-containing protein [Ramlibacter albus]